MPMQKKIKMDALFVSLLPRNRTYSKLSRLMKRKWKTPNEEEKVNQFKKADEKEQEKDEIRKKSTEHRSCCNIQIQ